MPVDTYQLDLFLVEAVLLLIVPGADSLLVLRTSIAAGRFVGFMTACGVVAGDIIHAVIATAGLSELLAASPIALGIMRYGGAGWLVWLGFRSLRSSSATRPVKVGNNFSYVRPSQSFLVALFTNIINIQVIFFYFLFIPEFIVPGIAPVSQQILAFGLIFASLDAIYMIIFILIGSSIGGFFSSKNSIRILEAVTGIIFLGFAFRLFYLQ